MNLTTDNGYAIGGLGSEYHLDLDCSWDNGG